MSSLVFSSEIAPSGLCSSANNFYTSDLSYFDKNSGEELPDLETPGTSGLTQSQLQNAMVRKFIVILRHFYFCLCLHAILFVSTKNRDLWPLPIFEHAYSIRSANQISQV